MHKESGATIWEGRMTTTLLADSELTKAHDFLFEAHMLVTDVRSLFFNIGNFATAARLKDIQARLADELRTVERLIAGSEPGLLTAPLPPAQS
jgi:hypothetical protein